MARPSRCRRICSEPKYISFSPCTSSINGEVFLTVDEYEVIRLIDFEGKTHEQCSVQMDISRTTVTEIYQKARFKIADCIVNGKKIYIKGGNYRLCDGSILSCEKKCLNYRKDYKNYKKGEFIMRVAVTYENGNIFQHFGHTENFKIYDIQDNKIIDTQIINTLGSGHGAIAGFLSDLKTDVLICGGIGKGAQMALSEAGIRLFGGVTGSADNAVNDFISGNLSYNPDAACKGHHHNGEHHHCNENKHGCSGKGGCSNE